MISTGIDTTKHLPEIPTPGSCGETSLQSNVPENTPLMGTVCSLERSTVGGWESYIEAKESDMGTQ